MAFLSENRTLSSMVGIKMRRVFLVEEKNFPEDIRQQFSREDAVKIQILQGYYQGGIQKRLRRERIKGKDPVFYMIQGNNRERISSKEFVAKWDINVRNSFSLQRHILVWEGMELYYDVFEGCLNGYVCVVAEFDTADESNFFTPPNWLGPEVTGKSDYDDYNLSTYGIPIGG